MNRAVPALSAGSAFLPTCRCRIIEPSGCWISLVEASPGSVNTGVRAPSCSSTIDSVSSGEPCGSIRSSRSPVWPMRGPGLVKVRVGPACRPAMNHTPPAISRSRTRTARTLRIRRDSTGVARLAARCAPAWRVRQDGGSVDGQGRGWLQFVVRAPVCRYRLGVRTRGSQPRDRGSIPRTGTIFSESSAPRGVTPRSHGVTPVRRRLRPRPARARLPLQKSADSFSCSARVAHQTISLHLPRTCGRSRHRALRVVIAIVGSGLLLDRGRLGVQEVVHDDQVVLPAVDVLARQRRVTGGDAHLPDVGVRRHAHE